MSPETPLIIRVNLRPEFHRPTRFRALVYLLLAIMSALVAFVSVMKGVAENSLLTAFAVVPFLLSLLWFIFAWLDWSRSAMWRRQIGAVHEPIPESELCEPNAQARWCTAVLLRHWRRSFRSRRLAAELRSAPFISPRAIVIGDPKWTSAFEEPTSDLLEPELIRATPSVGGMARLTPSIIVKFLSVVFLALLSYALLYEALRSRIVAPGILAVIILVVGIAALIISYIRRGYALPGGAGLMAGPSRVEWHGVKSVRQWTPADTIMIVHRKRSGSRQLTVQLISDGAAGSAPGARKFHFFGPDDPGVQTLWRMWIHPRQVERLTER